MSDDQRDLEPRDGFYVDFRREPLPDGLDLGDRAALRSLMLQLAEHEITMRGAPEPVLRIFCDDMQVVAPLAGVGDVGDEPKVAAFWHALGEIPGARHRFRLGTVLLGPEGAARTAAFVMSWEHHLTEGLQPGDELPKGLPGFGARWWLAYRFYGQGGGGTGVLHGEWVEREGVNFEGLDEPFRELLDSEGLGTSLPPLEWQPVPGPEMLTELVMRAPGVARPTSAEGYRAEIAALAVPEAMTKGIDRVWVFAFRADEWVEWWRIGGQLPCGLDDVLRNVARHSGAVAIGFVLVGAAQVPDGSTKRTLLTVAEFEGVRAQRQLVFDFPAGGRFPVVTGELMHDPVPVPGGNRWIGVAPGHDMKLKTEWVRQMGKGGVPGGPAAEG